MNKFLKWLLGFHQQDDQLKVKIDECKAKYDRMITQLEKVKPVSFKMRYLLAKRMFMPAQRKLDGYKSCDGIYDGYGNLVGVRLNSYFWKRPEVKKQLEASRRAR